MPANTAAAVSPNIPGNGVGRHRVWLLRVRGRAGLASLGLFHPSGRVGIADEVEKPAKQRQAVAAPEPEPSGVPGERIDESPGIVVPGADRISDHVCHCLGVLLVLQEV